MNSFFWVERPGFDRNLLLYGEHDPWLVLLSVAIGVIMSSSFSAIIVYAQELMPGRVGMIAGLFFGYWICRYLQTIPFAGGHMGGSGRLHIDIRFATYAQALMMALLSSSLASILPARAAGNMTPIDIIRSGG